MKSTLLAAIAYILILTNSYSQTNSKWFAHLSYTKTSDLSAWGSKIVVAGEYGVFIYDPDDASLSKYSKLNGLSSEKISSLQALRNTDAFILGFDTGEFDVVFSDSRVVNVKDIKNSSVSSLKNINCIAEYKNLIYLGTPFGIVVYDIENEEFGDTFFFGDNGSYIHVNDITFSGQDIFVATEEGVYKADAENPFLVDYKQWEKQKSIPTNSYNSIVGIGGKIIANNSESESVQYVLDDSTWDKAANQYARVTKMKSDGEFVSYSAAWSVHTFDKDLNKIETVSANTEIDFRANSSIWLNGHTWIATSSYGLVDKRDRVLYSTIPDGPSSNSSFRLKSGAKKLYLLYGGYLSDYKPLGNKSSYDTFEDGDWSFIDYSDILDSKDLVNVAIDPQDDKHIFVSSWNDGLIEMYENELVEQWNENNSAIQNQGEIHDSYKSFRIAGSAYDADGNLWIANAWYVDEPFVMKSANGDWYSFSVDRYIGGEDAGMSGICIDDNGNKWIGTRDEGIWVYNEGESLESSGDDKVSKFYTNQNRGNLPSERVNTVAIDKNNIAWIGTQAGLVVFSDIDDLH
ncbi:MAG: hypothetical protein KAH10_06240, partial [Flavobacteriales bacterium]|nr:hypothetical protein [Flavobacteriales bacterium]